MNICEGLKTYVNHIKFLPKKPNKTASLW
jgi:hypothetical protein